MSIAALFFLAASSLTTTTRAQSSSPPPPHGASSDAASTSPPLPLLLVVFVFAFFLTGFCSIYIRYCSEPQAPPQATRGLDPRVLAACSVASYSAAAAKRLRFNGASQCAVCLAEFADADALRLLPKCGHAFHAACIDAWLAAHVTCPVCRGEVRVEIQGEARAGRVFGEGSAKGFGLLLRSHSTGHSSERFNMRLSEQVVKKVLEDCESGSVMVMKRSASYDVVLRCGEGGEGSTSKEGNKSNTDNDNNNGWVLSMMTPSFVSRGSGSPHMGTAYSGIPRSWGAPVLREEKERQGRRAFHCEV
ncbi:E3 ubiquitin-protein ligase ATL6 [Spatholobus suberectus]|nr:E3 ubiquitin-protein ligase ATL6 [Spatholobus suberectus]